MEKFLKYEFGDGLSCLFSVVPTGNLVDFSEIYQAKDKDFVLMMKPAFKFSLFIEKENGEFTPLADFVDFYKLFKIRDIYTSNSELTSYGYITTTEEAPFTLFERVQAFRIYNKLTNRDIADLRKPLYFYSYEEEKIKKVEGYPFGISLDNLSLGVIKVLRGERYERFITPIYVAKPFPSRGKVVLFHLPLDWITDDLSVEFLPPKLKTIKRGEEIIVEERNRYGKALFLSKDEYENLINKLLKQPLECRFNPLDDLDDLV